MHCIFWFAFFSCKGFKVLLEFLIAALSIRNSLRHSSDRLSIHLESRSTMNASSFYRCLIISMTTTFAAGLVSILGSFSGASLHPWSWATIHASMSEVNIVSSQDQLESIQLAWWGGFVLTALYLLLSYCLGEETRDIFKWIRKMTRKECFVLPMQCVFFLSLFSKLSVYSILFSAFRKTKKIPDPFLLNLSRAGMTCWTTRFRRPRRSRLLQFQLALIQFPTMRILRSLRFHILVHQRRKLLAFRDRPFLRMSLRHPNHEHSHLSLPPFTRLLTI